MPVDDELHAILPSDIPHRDRLIEGAALHLRLIEEANEYMNLTRITSPREAAIKHVLDSVIPWQHFEAARTILDAGTGAGFPGIPLALVLPGVRFTLAESIGKKARFVASAVETLGLKNIEVIAARAEELLAKRKVDLITARAVAPLGKALDLLGPALRNGARALLYKGPDAELEVAEAAPKARKLQLELKLCARYELPDQLGIRTMVEISRDRKK